MRALKSIALTALALSIGVGGCEKKEEPSSQPAPTSEALPSEPVPAQPQKPATPPAAAAVPAVEASANIPAAAPANYEIDTAHSRVGFSVRHLGVSNTRGSFSKFSGTVFLDEATPQNSKVAVEIETASLDTATAKRDEHLRSPDFFDVKKHPKMTFKSSAVERVGGGYRVTGDLTIKGITKPTVLSVEPLTPEVKDPWGGVRRGTRAIARINRQDFGLTWNKALETGGFVVGDDVSIELELELLKKDKA